MTDKLLTVVQVFEVLQGHEITNNMEVVRRWLRQGKLEGIAPTSRKEGWKVKQSVLDTFILDHLAAIQKKNNTTKSELVVLNKDEIIADSRAVMWLEITRKNIWEGYYTITKKNVKDALEHRRYSLRLLDEVWDRLLANSSAYKQPRISYLLEAFSFEGQRVLIDNAFSGHERVLFPIIEHVRANRAK